MCKMDITPLSVAVQDAPLPILSILFDYSTHPQHGQLLHHAARRTSDDCFEVMKLVLDRYSSEVNKVMYEDHAFSFEIRKCVGLGTPLHEAARYGRPEVVSALLKYGANVQALDTCGQTAIRQAEMSQNYAVLDVLRHSLGIGPDIERSLGRGTHIT